MRMIFFLLASSFTAIANDVSSYDDWQITESVTNGINIVLAATVNDDDTSAGALCFNGACHPFVRTGLTCKEDTEYPFLLYFDTGLVALDLGCTVMGDIYLHELPSNYLDKLLSDNDFGVAYGIQGGKFKASYFSLSGSTKALLAARKRIEELDRIVSPKKEDTGTGFSEQL